MSLAPALIVYDGDCIFCQNYVRFAKLRDVVGPVELLDARSEDPRVSAFQREGYDLNEGMLFIYDGKMHHGDEAINLLALLSSTSTLFGKVNRLALSNPRVARIVYPFLKLGRRATLKLRGKSLIPDDLRTSGN